MSGKSISPVLLLGGAAAAYLLTRPATPGGNPVTNLVQSLIPGSTTATQPMPTNVGVNTGQINSVRGVLIANYAQLAQANPNLLNPNYQLTAAEAQQYYNNYPDLQTWFQTAAINKKFKGSIQAAMQNHWTNYGCAEKRIFIPLQPPSTIPYTPPPPNPKSSGSGILGSLLKVATVVAGGVVEIATAGAATPLVAAGTGALLSAEGQIHGPSDILNDAEVAVLFQGAAILYDILPFYASGDPNLTSQIKSKLDELLKQYS